MDNIIGYVVLNKAGGYSSSKCPNCPMDGKHLCSYPKHPQCHARCLHDRSQPLHQECIEYERAVSAWRERHPPIKHENGTTQIGVVHYNRNCKMLKRLQNAYVVGINQEIIEVLKLTPCAVCSAELRAMDAYLNHDQLTHTH